MKMMQELSKASSNGHRHCVSPLGVRVVITLEAADPKQCEQNINMLKLEVFEDRNVPQVHPVPSTIAILSYPNVNEY